MAILALEVCKCLNLRARFARRILEIHMKFALYHAVIQLAAFVCRTAVAAFKERVRAEDILLHRRIFRRASERRIKLLCLLLVEQPLTYLTTHTELYPLSVAFNQLTQKSTGVEFAGAALYILPMLLVYLYFQDDILLGVQLSELK